MPRSSSLSLEDLLAPLPVADFLRENWERTPQLVARNGSNPYSALLSLEDVDRIIAFTRPRFTDPAAFSRAAPTRSTYVRGVLADQPAPGGDFHPGIAEVREAFELGKSIVIMSMQHRWGPIAGLCRGLEATFHCPVHANMYLTPPGSQGFAAHYDPHEVFALQLEGLKTWRVYDQPEILPLPETASPPRKPFGEPREFRLQAGDLLYIPRGYVHEAFTADSFSFHLTVGINVYRWVDLLHHALSEAATRDPRFRESITGGALPPDRSQVRERFRELLELLSRRDGDHLLFDESLRSLGNQFFRELAVVPASGIENQAVMELINLETILEKRSEAICRVVQEEDQAAIEIPGNRLAGPARIAAALHFVATAGRFTPAELPGVGSTEAKLVL